MARPIKRLLADGESLAQLRRRARSSTVAVRDRDRAEMVLLRIEGFSVAAVAERLGTTPKRVSTWSKRFERSGLDGLEDKPGRGRKPSIPAGKVERVLTEATRPPKGRSRWSVRSMGRHAGVSPSTVQRIWSKNELKPHVVKTFKLSNDPKFEEKFWDVIGLYLDPPVNALVLCCDEKSQCQALERTQLSLPPAGKHPRTTTHDYKRHGTTTLFAALAHATGALIARTETSHTHVEWLRFLKQIDRETPRDLDLHLIADNYATHKHPKVRGWLDKHPRFKMHLHANLVVLAQSGRTILRRPHRRRDPLRQLWIGQRTGARHRGLPRSAQRQSNALRLARGGRRDPRQDQARPRGPRQGRSRMSYWAPIESQDTRGALGRVR